MNGYLDALLGFIGFGCYQIPLRFSKVKGLGFLSFIGIGILLVDIIFIRQFLELWKDPVWFWGSIFSGMLWALGQGFANLSLEELSLAKGSVLFNLNTLGNILVGVFLFGEVTGFSKDLFLILGTGLLLAGAIIVSVSEADNHKEGNLKVGVLLALLAAIFWGIYFAPIKALQISSQLKWPWLLKWEALNPTSNPSTLLVLSGLMMGAGITAFFFGIHGLLKGGYREVGLGAGSAILWAFGMIFSLKAIDILGLAKAIPIINSNVLLYAAWSFFVFKELPKSQIKRVVLGSILVIGGILLLSLS
jgi:glucose uptake protein GlcU